MLIRNYNYISKCKDIRYRTKGLEKAYNKSVIGENSVNCYAKYYTEQIPMRKCGVGCGVCA